MLSSFLVLLALIATSVERNLHTFPLQDPSQKPDDGENEEKETKDCSKCPDLYRFSQREFTGTNKVREFCARLSQIEKCIENSDCQGGFALLALGIGVKVQKRRQKCHTLDVNPTDMKNLFKKIEERKNAVEQPSDKCRYKQKIETLREPKHCGMFGDPHLKTFSDHRQTCVVAGAWSLLDNEFIAVQVTNEIVQETQSSSATATTKISVVFKETTSKCTEQKIYEATSSYLPEQFKDGSHLTGPDECNTVIKKPHKDQIIITSCYINTTVVIRRVGKYLTFNIQTPFQIANASSGLCSKGCPSSELVDYERSINEVPQEKHSRKDAMSICDNANLTDFYYDSCVFDIITTRDNDFAKAASISMRDAKRLDVNIRLRRENSVILNSELPSGLDPVGLDLPISSAYRTLLNCSVLLMCLFLSLS